MLKKIYNVFEKAGLFAVCLAFFWNFIALINNSNVLILTSFYFFFCLSAAGMTFAFRKRLIALNPYLRAAYIALITLLLRIAVCYFLNISQQGDFSVYLSAARQLNSKSLTNKLYYGIFPHALHYPMSMSILYNLIGEYTWLPRAVNLFFGIFEAALITLIAEKAINPRFGLMAGILTAFNPSIALYTLFATGEPIYSCLIMLALYLFIMFSNKEKNNSSTKSFYYWILIGIIIALADFFRPTAIIFVIALLITYWFFDNAKLKVKLICTISVLVPFLLIGLLFSSLTSSITGYKKASPSYGWNLYVGSNVSSRGQWNADDAELFGECLQEMDDPSEIQSHFAALAVDRYLDLGPKAIAHFKDKLFVWLDESFIPSYVSGCQNEYTRFQSKELQHIYFTICHYYNYFIIIGVVITYILNVTTKKGLLCYKLATLYMFGTMLMYMIVETNRRYKGGYYGMLTLLGAYGYYRLKMLLSKKLS